MNNAKKFKLTQLSSKLYDYHVIQKIYNRYLITPELLVLIPNNIKSNIPFYINNVINNININNEDMFLFYNLLACSTRVSGDVQLSKEFFEKSKSSMNLIFGQNSYTIAVGYHFMGGNYRLIDDVDGCTLCESIVEKIMLKLNFKEQFPLFYAVTVLSKFLEHDSVIT